MGVQHPGAHSEATVQQVMKAQQAAGRGAGSEKPRQDEGQEMDGVCERPCFGTRGASTTSSPTPGPNPPLLDSKTTDAEVRPVLPSGVVMSSRTTSAVPEGRGDAL